MDVGYFAAHEQYHPRTLLDHVARAEAAGFDTVWTSDHLHPWWHTDAECGAAWPWLGAALAQTESVRIGTGVTPPIARYHPAVIAQVFATLGAIAPGRVFCTLATGEAMNERPLGFEWPAYAERQRRLVEACEIIDRLFDGGFHSYSGDYWQLDTMKLYTLPAERVPIYVAANGPNSAHVAGQYADGWLTTISDPDVIENRLRPALVAGAEKAGRDPGTIRQIKHLGVSIAPEYDRALDGVETWLGPMVLGHEHGVYDPRELESAREEVERDDWASWGLVTTDPTEIIDEIDRYRELGFDEVELISASPDQDFFIEQLESFLPIT